MLIFTYLCAGVTKGTFRRDFLVRKAVQNFQKENFPCEFVYKHSLLCIH